MTKQEFIDAVKAYEGGSSSPSITSEDFNIIQRVYASHPSISDNPEEARRQIAILYVTCGMCVFRDMRVTADVNQDFLDIETSLRACIERCKDERKNLREGDIYIDPLHSFRQIIDTLTDRLNTFKRKYDE